MEFGSKVTWEAKNARHQNYPRSSPQRPVKSGAHAFVSVAFTRPSDPVGQWLTRTRGESVCVFTEVGENSACLLHRGVGAPSFEGPGPRSASSGSRAVRGLRPGAPLCLPAAPSDRLVSVSVNRASEGNDT